MPNNQDNQPPQIEHESTDRVYQRGPKRKMGRLSGVVESRKRFAEVAVAIGIPLSVVGLTTAKAKGVYRINLGQHSLAAALDRDPDTLTAQDKAIGYEVFLYGKEQVQDLVNEALYEHGLSEFYEVVCPDVPTVLEANLARVKPNTPSFSVFWPDDLRGPELGRTKFLLVPIEKIRPGIDDELASVNDAPPVTSSVSELPDDQEVSHE